MTSTTKPPPRKNVALPADVVERVDAFRKAQNISSESDALRRLIETGLNFFDRPRDLFLRCAMAFERGASIGDIVGKILNDHPLIEEVVMKADLLEARLTKGQGIYLNRTTKEWAFEEEKDGPAEFYPSRRGGWDAPDGPDEKIPF